MAREVGEDAAREEVEERRDVRDAELVRALKEISSTHVELLKTQKDSRRSPIDVDSDRYNAVSRFEMKQNVPILKDKDLDLDRHLMEVNSLLDCHCYGNQTIRPIDQLNIFRRSLEQGGTRQQMTDIIINRATKAKRLPHDAKDVYEEVLAKLRKIMRETPMEKKERAEADFDRLEMGKLAHSTFRVKWEQCLDALEDAGVQDYGGDGLFRRYLKKIPTDLRSAIMKQGFPFGQGRPPAEA